MFFSIPQMVVRSHHDLPVAVTGGVQTLVDHRSRYTLLMKVNRISIYSRFCGIVSDPVVNAIC